MPERIQLHRVKGWRLPPNAVSVARPTKWGNPFPVGKALARVPAALGGGDWEYEGRISAAGMRHDYFHPDGRVTVCHVRYMTLPEIIETYERALTGNHTPAMGMTGARFLKVTAEDARRELAGKDLACWCDLDSACHADVLLKFANAPECRHCGGVLVRCDPPHDFPVCKGWKHAAWLSMGPIGPHYCEGRSVNPSGEPATAETEEGNG
jgi:hypothetical protein